MNIGKSAYGWYAETFIPFNGSKQIQIFTMKRYDGQLVTTSKLVTRDGHSISYVMGQEQTRILVAETPERVTQKVVAAQHQKALEIYNQ